MISAKFPAGTDVKVANAHRHHQQTVMKCRFRALNCIKTVADGFWD
jgi:hypothetical protein